MIWNLVRLDAHDLLLARRRAVAVRHIGPFGAGRRREDVQDGQQARPQPENTGKAASRSASKSFHTHFPPSGLPVSRVRAVLCRVERGLIASSTTSCERRAGVPGALTPTKSGRHVFTYRAEESCELRKYDDRNDSQENSGHIGCGQGKAQAHPKPLARGRHKNLPTHITGTRSGPRASR